MVAIVGRKHHGKTTLVVGLAAELGRRGHRVMTIKHGTHTFNVDPATTDTYRHYHEGRAARVAMVSPDKFALIERLERQPTAEEVAERYMRDADVVLCEGFKRSGLPKIEVFRRAAGSTPLVTAAERPGGRFLAVVSDGPLETGGVPVIQLESPDCFAQVADLVERQVMGSA